MGLAEDDNQPLLISSSAAAEEVYEQESNGGNLIRRILFESKKTWHIAGPSIFNRIALFSLTVISQSFAGRLSDLDLAAISIVTTVIIGITFGFLLWLCDKLNQLYPPVPGWNQFPQRIHQREMRYPDMAIEEWYLFLCQLHSTEIVWRCPWLDLPAMSTHFDGFDRMVIAGLTRITFYIPGRFLCQLGLPQENSQISVGDFRVPNFTAQTLNG